MTINLTATAGSACFHYRFDQREVLVGRSETVDVRLPHPSVSLVHLCLRIHEGRLMVMDSESTNGTTLDGEPLEPLEPVPLPPGGRLSVGIFEIVAGEPESGELTAPRDTAGFARRMVLEVLGEQEHPALVVQNGSDRGQQLAIGPDTGPLVVGRDTGCDLRLGDADASRRHLEVRRQDDAVQVRDLESKNGIQVGGAFIEGWFTLEHGAELRIGKTVLRYCDPAETYLQELGSEPAPQQGRGEAAPKDDGGRSTSPEDRQLWRLDLALVSAAAALVLGAAGLILYFAGWI